MSMKLSSHSNLDLRNVQKKDLVALVNKNFP